MTLAELQRELASLGAYKGAIDGIFGPMTKTGIISALTLGADTGITNADVQHAAERLKCPEAAVWAVYDVEASGSPFIDGRPTILFEPHRFSKLTKSRFDKSHPVISYSKWGQRPYPRTQTERYEQLTTAISLDVDAALAATSYGGFQILGEHYKALGYRSPWEFAYQQSLSVGEQLNSFITFVIVNRLDVALRRLDWATFARGYNGSGFRKNQYDTRLASRFAFRSIKRKAA